MPYSLNLSYLQQRETGMHPEQQDLSGRGEYADQYYALPQHPRNRLFHNPASLSVAGSEPSIHTGRQSETELRDKKRNHRDIKTARKSIMASIFTKDSCSFVCRTIDLCFESLVRAGNHSHHYMEIEPKSYRP